MTDAGHGSWDSWNQHRLLVEFVALRERLGAGGADDEVPGPPFEPQDDTAPAAIDVLTETFGLSPFERDLVLLCAGVEMDLRLSERCAALLDRPRRGFVTFGLALGRLAQPHWSALAPSAPLRQYRLLDIVPGHGLTAAPLHIDERILHFLAGVNRMDARLEGLLHPKSPTDLLVDEHWRLASEVIAPVGGGLSSESALHLCGDDPAGQEAVAAIVADRVGRELYILRVEDAPAPGGDLEQFLALWRREAALLPAMLLLQWGAETPTPATRQLAERLPGPLLMASREPVRLNRTVEHHEVNKASPLGQRRLWEAALGTVAAGLGGAVEAVSEQFRLSAETVDRLGAAVASGARPDDEALPERLWSACRSISRPRLETLAQRIVPAAAWDDLILPELQAQMLRQLAAQSRNRMTVYERWGFADRGRRGLGLTALFAGPSGTGKTLAAEVLATDLRLDMYRIDLSGVVSKYIGETEKNLKQVFDAAETGGVLLLFDEADAIFGKRGEVKDSHDRYANIEVGYLLQRMESFQGLAILTTNLKSSLDKAFQRRLRFIIDFPLPAAVEREAMWARAFPGRTPTKGLDPALLSSLQMSGGAIRNIALNAAFLAAEQDEPVQMSHVLQATQFEAAKAERPISPVEIRGWR